LAQAHIGLAEVAPFPKPSYDLARACFDVHWRI